MSIDKEYLWMPPEARAKFLTKLREYLADPARAHTDFVMDYFEADMIYRALKRNLGALTWFVEVECAGGWMICGAFSDEASAWEFGKKNLEVRVYKGDELLGVKDGYKKPWRAPTKEELHASRDS